MDAKAHGYRVRSNVRRAGRNEEGRDASGAFLQHDLAGLLDVVDAADAGAHDYADVMVVAPVGEVDAAVADGFHAGVDGVEDRAVVAGDIPFGKTAGGRVVMAFAGDMHFIVGGIKKRNGADAGSAVRYAVPVFGDSVARGGDGAETGHYYSFIICHNSNIISYRTL